MKRIVAYIRPHKLEGVKTAISTLGITGLTVGDARGTGTNPEVGRWGNQEGVVAMPVRARIETVVNDEIVEPAIQAIIENAFTGEPGDGKIFVQPVLEAIRIRTGDRGEEGL